GSAASTGETESVLIGGETWNNAFGDAVDLAAVMNSARAKTFVDIADFKAAAAQLTQLVSTAGRRYPVKKVLSREGGESLVLLCSDPNGRDVVAKVYFRPVEGEGSSIEARCQVLSYMATPEGKRYTLAVSDVGTVELNAGKYYFEIMPFCPGGDLTDYKSFSFQALESLIQYLNEALHSMHSAGILHRDLKPANLYRLEDRIVLGDFGVAKMAGRGATTITVGTDGFRPPESLLALSAGDAAFIFDESGDYYSLGVTLGCLFEGRFVYEGLSAAEITVAVRNERLPLRRQDPRREELENLLKGLCRYDPRYRFTYEDVKRWLVDHNYTGGVIGDEWPKAMRVFKQEIRDERSLFFEITKDREHWEEGKELLYGKHFENFFKSFRTDLSRAAQKADDEWRMRDRDKGLAIFLKTLYAPGPLVWNGATYKSLAELAGAMLSTASPRTMSEILQKRLVSHWLRETEGIQADRGTVALVDEIESVATDYPELSCFWFGNSFSGRRSVRICGREAKDMKGLLHVMFSEPAPFYTKDGWAQLTDRKQGGRLYGFLYSLGYRQLADETFREADGCDEFNKLCLLLVMMDSIAVREKADPAVLRGFFRESGPMGIATCTKRLAEMPNSAVYLGLDPEGKKLLAKVRDFRLPENGPLDRQYRELIPLLEQVDKMHEKLIDDPFCISSGVFEPRGILCKDLSGCFAFQIFDRLAPLGFQSVIGA
ncbi:MAG: protein kinase, partial [Oscillospiraceae bacterium]|nr:protein kinase [Oscillospiraceae bacterium]